LQCAKYPNSPHRRDWNFLGRGTVGVLEARSFKEMYEAYCEFPEG